MSKPLLLTVLLAIAIPFIVWRHMRDETGRGAMLWVIDLCVGSLLIGAILLLVR